MPVPPGRPAAAAMPAAGAGPAGAPAAVGTAGRARSASPAAGGRRDPGRFAPARPDGDDAPGGGATAPAGPAPGPPVFSPSTIAAALAPLLPPADRAGDDTLPREPEGELDPTVLADLVAEALEDQALALGVLELEP